MKKMLPLLVWWKYWQAIILLYLFWYSEGLNLAASFPGPTEKASIAPVKHFESMSSASHQTPSLQSIEISTSLQTSSNLATPSLESPLSSTSSSKPANLKSSLINSTLPSSTNEAVDASPSIAHSPVLNLSFTSSSSYHAYPPVTHPAVTLPSSMRESGSIRSYLHATASGLLQREVIHSKSDEAVDAGSFTHFHTPLMSLLVATPSSSSPWQTVEPSSATASPGPQSGDGPALTTTTSSDNESSSINNPTSHPSTSSVVPTTTATTATATDQDHNKKLLMLVLRAEDCARFSKSDFERMLSRLMARFGFGDVVPEVSNARCYSHLNINVTIGGATPTLRFLPNVQDGGRNNFTVDVLNRTFRIIKLEKVDLRLEKTKSSPPPANASSDVIAAVARHESVAYIAVGVSFGLILVICVSVCCIKCCCLRKPQKRYGIPKGATHVRLRPEDYTLTPIPRPTSLYVDYYRGSGTADIYSTTSAGSIASTTPTVEQGVVQPFDTSIVPLEDSSNLPLDSSRDPSVESVPVQSDLKTFNIHNFAGKGFRAASTDSKEQLNPKAHSRKVETKPSGVTNPTFQRY